MPLTFNAGNEVAHFKHTIMIFLIFVIFVILPPFTWLLFSGFIITFFLFCMMLDKDLVLYNLLVSLAPIILYLLVILKFSGYISLYG